MQFSKTLFAAMSAALFSTTAAFAESPLPAASDVLVKYAEVEDWTVYNNETRRDCLIVRSVGLTAVQMGVTPANPTMGYLGVFTKADIGLTSGNQSQIFVSIDGNLYEGVATATSGGVEGNYSGGYILSDNPQFRKDLAKKYEMVVFPETNGAFIVDLKGTYKAMAKARECLESQPAALIKPVE